MLNQIDVTSWSPQIVKDWLEGILEDSSWLDCEAVFAQDITGKKLLVMSAYEIEKLGATKVYLQELLMESLEKLKFYNYTLSNETLQTAILRLSCQARSLQQLVAQPASRSSSTSSTPTGPKTIVLSPDFSKDNSRVTEQRVTLDTLAGVSSIVTIVKHITNILSCTPFAKRADYRSMKSLILALSIELTSTAQRDQFVDQPNDVIERSCKALADYCDKVVHGTKESLMIEPFNIVTVKINKLTISEAGLIIKSTENGHYIKEVIPLTAAKKTNKLTEGDEVLMINQFIIGWSPKSVKRLIDIPATDCLTIMVKKCPSD